MTQNNSDSHKKDTYSYTDILFGSREKYSHKQSFFNSVSLFSALAACFASITNIALTFKSETNILYYFLFFCFVSILLFIA